MRVLVAHNRYRTDVPSGENKVVDAEIELLLEHGVEVLPMIEESDSIQPGIRGALQAAPGPIYSRSGVSRFRDLLRAGKPDIVHVHNVFPLISPWVVRVANEYGAPVVQTIHNYRHSCVNGLHFRDHHVCTDCLGTRTNWPAIMHGCYRDSRLQSTPMVIGQHVHRRTWESGIARFIALTPFMADMLVSAGLPRQKITIRPSWVSDPGEQAPGNPHALFVGRLDENKGIDILLHAWRSMGNGTLQALHVVGSGTRQPSVEEAARHDPRIVYHGQLTSIEVSQLMRGCGVVVVPSTGFEGYPLVIAEAFGHGRPVITLLGGSSATTGTPETGWRSAPSIDGLAGTLSGISLSDIRFRGAKARQYYETHNSPSAAVRRLVTIYRSVIAEPGPSEGV